MKHIVRRTNPRSKWPYRIVRISADGRRTHKLLIKFRTADKAAAYIERHVNEIARFA